MSDHFDVWNSFEYIEFLVEGEDVHVTTSDSDINELLGEFNLLKSGFKVTHELYRTEDDTTFYIARDLKSDNLRCMFYFERSMTDEEYKDLVDELREEGIENLDVPVIDIVTNKYDKAYLSQIVIAINKLSEKELDDIKETQKQDELTRDEEFEKHIEEVTTEETEHIKKITHKPSKQEEKPVNKRPKNFYDLINSREK